MMQQEPHPTTDQYANKRPKIKKTPEKITQMQCLQTNNQLQLFFQQALNQSFKYLPNVLSKIYLELELIVGFIEYRLTVSKGEPHPGDYLQNISYVQTGFSQTKKLLYLILTVLLPYIKRRIHNYVLMNPQGWRGKLLNLLTYCDKILTVLQFINYALFLYKGNFRNLTQRILKIQMQFINKDNSRILDFSLMNRKLIWSIYQLFLKMVLPYFHGFFSKTLKNVFYLNSYLDVDQSERSCIICHQNLTMPMQALPCQHSGCYYCIVSQIDVRADGNKCKKCGEIIENWEKMF